MARLRYSGPGSAAPPAQWTATTNEEYWSAAGPDPLAAMCALVDALARELKFLDAMIQESRGEPPTYPDPPPPFRCGTCSSSLDASELGPSDTPS
jgi:hypothetical protein